MIIACDADGVTCNLDTPWLARYNRDYNDTMTRAQWTSWDVHNLVKPECGKKIYDYLQDPTLYDDVQPIDGCVEGIRELRDAGHEVIFATTCSFGMTDQKAEWFIRHGLSRDKSRGVFLPKDFFPCSDKLKLDAHLLIDDNAETIRGWVNKSRRAVLFEYPWNHGLLNDVPSTFWNWCTRVTSWREITSHILGGSV